MSAPARPDLDYLDRLCETGSPAAYDIDVWPIITYARHLEALLAEASEWLDTWDDGRGGADIKRRIVKLLGLEGK